MLSFVRVCPVAPGRVRVSPSLDSPWHFIQHLTQNGANKCLVNNDEGWEESMPHGRTEASDRSGSYTDETDRETGSPHLYGIFGRKMSFLLHAARTRVLICGTHMLQMLLFLLWSDHHDKGPACSINRESDWFHILLWFSDRLPGATSRSMSDSIHPSYTDTHPPSPGRWQSSSLNSAQRSFKDFVLSEKLNQSPLPGHQREWI